MFKTVYNTDYILINQNNRYFASRRKGWITTVNKVECAYTFATWEAASTYITKHNLQGYKYTRIDEIS